MTYFHAQDLHAGYGSAQVLHGVSLSVEKGEAVAVLGPNGAGKSTMMNALSGIVRPTQGSVLLEERELVGRSPHKIVAAGLVHVPEGRHVFPEMSVEQNLQLGAFTAPDGRDERLAMVTDLFPRLRERYKQAAHTLSGGEQQMVAIGRGLMANPRLLVLDEPTLGLAPILVEEILQRLQEAKEAFGLSVLVAEQNSYLAAGLCDRYYVMINGSVVDELAEIPEDMSELMAIYTGSTVGAPPTRRETK